MGCHGAVIKNGTQKSSSYDPCQNNINEGHQPFDCTRTIIHALKNRFYQTGSADDHQKPGAPRAKMSREDRLMHLMDLHCDGSVNLQYTFQGLVCGKKTEYNRSRAYNLHARRSYFGTILTRYHRTVRLRWA